MALLTGTALDALVNVNGQSGLLLARGDVVGPGDGIRRAGLCAQETLLDQVADLLQLIQFFQSALALGDLGEDLQHTAGADAAGRALAAQSEDLGALGLFGAAGSEFRSTPTIAAVEVARASDITLLGFSRENRFNIYSATHRLKGCMLPIPD